MKPSLTRLHLSDLRVAFVESQRIPNSISRGEIESLRKRFPDPSKVNIVVVEDEAMHFKGLQTLVRQIFPQLSQPILQHVTTVGRLRKAIDPLNPPDLIIFDLDLNHDTETGFDGLEWAAGLARERGLTWVLCVHSNRTDSETLREVVGLGADLVFPKPMTASHMVSLLKNVASRAGICEGVGLENPL